MRNLFILTALMSLLVVGYLVIQNMGAHTKSSETGRVEEIEQARKTVSQAEEKLESVSRVMNQSDRREAVLP